MTKEQKRALSIICPFVISLMCFWYIDSENVENGPEYVTSPASMSAPENQPKTQLRAPASVPQIALKDAVSPAVQAPIWKENLEKTLRAQGGSFIKDIEIEKVDSFDWKVGNVDVRVDSIKVSLKNVKGQRSSFRAIVDASNGKILQTWDQPIIDNFSANAGGTIKIDSRYHND